MDEVFQNLIRGERWIFHLLFYRIPKNASTSIHEHLGQLNLIKKYEQRFHQNADKKIYRGWFDPTHAKPNEVYQVFRREMANYFSFCVARNPWDRAVSMYHFALKNDLGRLYDIDTNMTFETFCEILNDRKDDKTFIAAHKQTEWMEGFYPPNVVLRFENLHQEFEMMLMEYNIMSVRKSLPHKNKTDHKPYQEYYNKNTKEIIKQMFEKDIDVLKYTFQP
jgi:hypothetical protein